jgi:hypothetical protein
MKKLPRDLSTFETLITQNYVYVDKTEHIYNLYATGDRYHFLSRPRRFGKSLLISTLKELFLGNKHLFKDLWIASSDFPWQKYPIVHLDFAAVAQRTPHDLNKSLNYHLDCIAQSYGLTLENATLPEEKLESLIVELAHFNKVVVLIDEYNYPLLGHLADIKLAEEQEKILKNFYGVLKSLDAYLHTLFITGVSKFSKSSIFSGINNLIDIGMSSLGETLLGFTDQEIKDYFHDHIIAFSQAKNRTTTEIIHEMKTMYNGYRFTHEKNSLHNPFAVLYYLKEQELQNYWYESGVPLLLVNLLYKQLESLDSIAKVEFDAETLDVFDINNIPLITLLFQTGYLTIKNYNQDTNKFILNYPNEYIEHAFKKNVIEALAHTNAVIIEQSLVSIKKAFIDTNFDQLCSTLSYILNIFFKFFLLVKRFRVLAGVKRFIFLLWSSLNAAYICGITAFTDSSSAQHFIPLQSLIEIIRDFISSLSMQYGLGQKRVVDMRRYKKETIFNIEFAALENNFQKL